MTQHAEALVPVQVPLRGATFVHFEHAAKQRGTTIATLLALLADAAVPAEDRELRRYVKVTPDMRDQIRRLHGLGYSPQAISQAVGCSRPSVYNYLPNAAVEAMTPAPGEPLDWNDDWEHE